MPIVSINYLMEYLSNSIWKDFGNGSVRGGDEANGQYAVCNYSFRNEGDKSSI